MEATSQVISINDEGNSFSLHEDRLSSIFEKIPEGMKVSVISVVGRFRSGKSFLLDFFVKWLRYHNCEVDQSQNGSDWMLRNGKHLDGYDDAAHGFSWKTGRDRHTTGIWIWNEPFFVKHKETGEKLAVLLVDTQGMFDNQTSQMLTACIFALGALISSFQIFNLSKQIGEDNLMQLSYFSEYGKQALRHHKVCDDQKKCKPFQSLGFLVRDAPEYIFEEGTVEEQIAAMDTDLKTALSADFNEEVRDTRDQIQGLFDEISCFMLPYPGRVVERKSFTGDIEELDEDFLSLLRRYVETVFTEKLQPKTFFGNAVDAPALFRHFKAFCEAFQGTEFPKAETLLAATAQANNTNAIEASINNFKKEMDQLVGVGCSFVEEEELAAFEKKTLEKSLGTFNEIATFGSEEKIESSRQLLKDRIKTMYDEYMMANKDRDPFKAVRMYILPLLIAFVAWFVDRLSDYTCDPYVEVCRKASDLLWFVYMSIFTFLFIMAFSHGRKAYVRACKIFNLLFMTGESGKSSKSD
eukprot:TRINITY_DN774121_c0_g1_i1.p1 TRINITY_DN774121_c0_g1~~TRINITY_DN774121_c0_g1_i1.p1  ORF type:complete len:541 (-),score=160.91 TRINITY_DN774121_c0_g1_i1:588-2156(-)